MKERFAAVAWVAGVGGSAEERGPAAGPGGVIVTDDDILLEVLEVIGLLEAFEGTESKYINKKWIKYDVSII